MINDSECGTVKNKLVWKILYQNGLRNKNNNATNTIVQGQRIMKN